MQRNFESNKDKRKQPKLSYHDLVAAKGKQRARKPRYEREQEENV